MKKLSVFSSRAAIFLAFLMAFQSMFSSCTIIGLATGGNISEKKNKNRPVIAPERDAIIKLEIGTWMDVVEKDGKTTVGKYTKLKERIETNGDTTLSIVLHIMGQKKDETVSLDNINHIVVGYQSNDATVFGGVIGAIVDLMAVITGAILLNKLTEGGHE